MPAVLTVVRSKTFRGKTATGVPIGWAAMTLALWACPYGPAPMAPPLLLTTGAPAESLVPSFSQLCFHWGGGRWLQTSVSQTSPRKPPDGTCFCFPGSWEGGGDPRGVPMGQFQEHRCRHTETGGGCSDGLTPHQLQLLNKLSPVLTMQKVVGSHPREHRYIVSPLITAGCFGIGGNSSTGHWKRSPLPKHSNP